MDNRSKKKRGGRGDLDMMRVGTWSLSTQSSEMDEKKGWSKLHVAAATGDITTLEKVIEELGKDQAAILAKQFTHDTNHLPIQLMQTNREYKFGGIENRSRFLGLLEPLTLHHPIPSLDQKLSLQDIKKNYPDLKENSILYKNLTLAYQVINHTRQVIKKSTVHPDSNLYTEIEKTKLEEKIATLRSLVAEVKSDSEIKRLDGAAKIIAEKGIGNCHEFTELGMHRIRELDKTVMVEAFSFANGGHEWIVIGRDPNSDPTDYRTWGPNAVICDPWGGYAVPAAHASEKLIGYFYYQLKKLHCVVPFDPNYHILVLNKRIPTIEEPKNNNTFFSNKEKDSDAEKLDEQDPSKMKKCIIL